MNAYSLDLRKKIVEAKQRGTLTVEVARTFGVGVSSVKRYVAAARQGRPLWLPRDARLQAQAGRERQAPAGGRPRRAPGGDPLLEARVPVAGVRD